MLLALCCLVASTLPLVALLPLSLIAFPQKLLAARRRHPFIVIGAVPAAIAAATASFEMVFFGKHHQALFIEIKINPLLQRHVRWFLVVPAARRPGWAGRLRAAGISGNECGCFVQCRGPRNVF